MTTTGSCYTLYLTANLGGSLYCIGET